MRLADLPGAPHLTYCTNIHAGESWPAIRASLGEHLPPIREAVAPGQPFGLGLRLSGIAADALVDPGALDEFRDFLARLDAYVFTLNAFPYGPFHGTRVKEDVYQPDWLSDERLRFTRRAADILAALLPEDVEGSISTVPGTFRALAASPGAAEAMTARLVDAAAHLAGLDRTTGRRIALALEPEPACFLETTDDAVRFFEEHLFGPEARRRMAEATGLRPSEAEAALRRHLGVCWDVCHAAVEFEQPASSLAALANAGIAVPKLQISSAIRLPAIDGRAEALLRRFDEGVYLHQVVERRDGRLTRHVDLPDAFAALRAGAAGGEWRVHCHVPVFLSELGPLGTTQGVLLDALAICRERAVAPHLEVETYTWDVLPPEHAGADKAEAIVRELRWTLEALR